MFTRRSVLKSFAAAGIAGVGIREVANTTAYESEVQDFGIFHGPLIAGRLKRGMTLSAGISARGLALSFRGLNLGLVATTQLAPVRVRVAHVETDEFNRYRLFVRVERRPRNV